MAPSRRPHNCSKADRVLSDNVVSCSCTGCTSVVLDKNKVENTRHTHTHLKVTHTHTCGTNVGMLGSAGRVGSTGEMSLDTDSEGLHSEGSEGDQGRCDGDIGTAAA